MKSIDKKELRMDQLEQIAEKSYLDKTDFNAVEWLDEEETKEYMKLWKEVNGEICPNCHEEMPPIDTCENCEYKIV